MKSLWPDTQSAEATPYDDSVTDIGADNVQDAIEVLASISSSADVLRTLFLRMIRVATDSYLKIQNNGALTIASGTNQLNVLTGHAVINGNSSLEILSNSNIQIRTV